MYRAPPVVFILHQDNLTSVSGVINVSYHVDECTKSLI
jgi:hypothetical protein